MRGEREAVAVNLSDGAELESVREGSMNRHREVPAYFHYYLVLAAFFMMLSLALCLLSSPIADDFAYLTYMPTHSLWHDLYLYNWGSTFGGRFAAWTVAILAVKIFRGAAIQVLPALDMLGFVLVTARLLWLAMPALRGNRLMLAVTACLAAGAIFLSMPSFFDLAWFNAAVFYLSSLVALAFLILAVVEMSRARRLSTVHHIALFVVAAFCLGFNVPANLFALLGLGVGAVWSVRNKRWGVTRTYLAALSGGIAALIFLVFSPATRGREHVQGAALGLRSIVFGPFRDFHFVAGVLLSWRLVPLLTLAVFLALVAPQYGRETLRRLTLVGAALCLLPVYITGVGTRYAHEAYPYSPLRTETVPISLFVVGAVLLIVAGLQYFRVDIRNAWKILLAPALVLSGFAGVFLTTSTLKAEVLRQSLLRYRAASIKQQLAQHKTTITVYPAPLPLGATDASDIAFNDRQSGWVVPVVKAYYGIGSQKIRLVKSPPAGYCLKGSSASWWGAYTCEGDVLNYAPRR